MLAFVRDVGFQHDQVLLAGAAHDLEQILHRTDLLDLFLNEPVEEILGSVVVLVASDVVQVVDLTGNFMLPVER
jgi:hypothetical protein